MPESAQQLVRVYAEDKFLPSQVHLRPNSASTDASQLRTHVYPLLGERRIGSLQKSDIKAFVATKAAELAPSTVETVVAVLRAMLATGGNASPPDPGPRASSEWCPDAAANEGITTNGPGRQLGNRGDRCAPAALRRRGTRNRRTG
jgi:hypothetical protein